MEDSARLRLPYCGTAPAPAELWARWNLDPILIAVLALFLVLYVLGCARLEACGRSAPDRAARRRFLAGWLIGAAALVSPLCALSVALFTARIAQHMILSLIAVPLMASARPGAVLTGLWGHAKSFPPPRRVFSAAALFAVLLWLWHTPALYAASFGPHAVYWAMHVSLIGAALWLWCALLSHERRELPRIVVAAFASFMQMGLLGALITLAPRLLYTQHLLTASRWNLTPLADQQLGGVIMWVPACVAFLGIAVLALARVITETPALAPAGDLRR